MGAPARAHVVPGAGRPSPARAFWATAAAPPEPGRGISLPPVGGKGARAGAPSSSPSDSCQQPGSAWHPAGLSEESLLGVAALLEGRGGSEELGGSRGRPQSVLRARTPDSSGLRSEGAAAGPGRACARTRCHLWGLVSAPGLAPSPLPPPRGGREARSARAAAGGESAAVSPCVPTRLLPKAPGPERDGLLERAKTLRAAAAASAHLRCDTLGCGWTWGGNLAHRSRGRPCKLDGGEGRPARVRRGRVSPPGLPPWSGFLSRLVAMAGGTSGRQGRLEGFPGEGERNEASQGSFSWESQSLEVCRKSPVRPGEAKPRS